MNDDDENICCTCSRYLTSIWFTDPYTGIRRNCVACAHGKLACAACHAILVPANFSQTQLSRGIEAKCRDCTAEPRRDTHSSKGGNRHCGFCRKSLPLDMFTRSQISRHGAQAFCKDCTEPRRSNAETEPTAESPCVVCHKRRHPAEFTLEANGRLCRHCFYNTTYKDNLIGGAMARQLRHEESLRLKFPQHKFETTTTTINTVAHVVPANYLQRLTCAMCAVSSDDFPDSEHEFDNPRCRSCIRKLCPIDVAKASVVHFQIVVQDPAMLAFAVNAMLRNAEQLDKRGTMFGIVHK